MLVSNLLLSDRPTHVPWVSKLIVVIKTAWVDLDRALAAYEEWLLPFRYNHSTYLIALEVVLVHWPYF